MKRLLIALLIAIVSLLFLAGCRTDRKIRISGTVVGRQIDKAHDGEPDRWFILLRDKWGGEIWISVNEGTYSKLKNGDRWCTNE